MMDANTVVAYAWVVWSALILIFIIIEVFTLDFTFLMLALGSVGGLVSSLFAIPVWAQVIIAAVLSIALLFGVRPPLLRRLRKGADPTLSNVEALIGITGTVVSEFVDGVGYTKLANGETWTSRRRGTSGLSALHTSELKPGDRVVVVTIEGATAVVEPVAAGAAS